MKTLTVRQMAAVKRVAQNVNPLVVKKNKIVAKMNELHEEYVALEDEISGHELGIKAITGGYTCEDLIVKTVEDSGKVDKDGKSIKVTKYEPSSNVVFNEDTKLYEIHMPNAEVVNASEVDDTAAVEMVQTDYSQVDEVMETLN